MFFSTSFYISFEYKESDFVPDWNILKKDAFFDFTFLNTVLNNKVSERIEEYYGGELCALYFFTISMFNLHGIGSIAAYGVIMKKEDFTKVQKQRFNRLKNKVYKRFRELIYLFDHLDSLVKYFGQDVIDKLKDIKPLLNEKRYTLGLIKQVHEKLQPFIIDLVFEQNFNFRRVENAKNLIEELKALATGHRDWVNYEKLCIKALNFLFVPPFRKIYFQARNNDGYERRDSIIPNNSTNGFWYDIKNEFKSKNIVCEFKNVSKIQSKEVLNQLRIYLSKPTIGKFGLLFIRNNEKNKILYQAQRDAYEQNGILILIITDSLLKKLLLAKAYFDSCDDVIANEKIRFEINY